MKTVTLKQHKPEKRESQRRRLVIRRGFPLAYVTGRANYILGSAYQRYRRSGDLPEDMEAEYIRIYWDLIKLETGQYIMWPDLEKLYYDRYFADLYYQLNSGKVYDENSDIVGVRALD